MKDHAVLVFRHLCPSSFASSSSPLTCRGIASRTAEREDEEKEEEEEEEEEEEGE